MIKEAMKTQSTRCLNVKNLMLSTHTSTLSSTLPSSTPLVLKKGSRKEERDTQKEKLTQCDSPIVSHCLIGLLGGYGSDDE